MEITPHPLHRTTPVNPTFTTPAIFATSQLPSAVKNRIGNMEINTLIQTTKLVHQFSEHEIPKFCPKSTILSHLTFSAPSPRDQLHIPIWRNYIDISSADKMREGQTRSAVLVRKVKLVHPIIKRITTAHQPGSLAVPCGKHSPSGFEKQINERCIGK